MSSDRKLHFHYTHTLYHSPILTQLQQLTIKNVTNIHYKTYKLIEVQFSTHRIFQSSMSELFIVLHIYTVQKFLTLMNIAYMITVCQKKILALFLTHQLLS